MAAAKGCSLPRSSVAARRNKRSTSNPSAGSTATSLGLPSVSVPVLSTTSVSTLRISSTASAFLNRTPRVAPFPIATMMDIGVASPSAHGQAMISTATALTMACARRGSGPHTAQMTNVSAAMPTTMGTKYPATTSASFWIGARLRCASLTIRTICANRVSDPTRSARIISEPVPFTVAPVTRAPFIFSTGIGSPLIMDSSTLLEPSRTTPSTGIFSPGRTLKRSPGLTWSSGTSTSVPSSRIRRAVFGARPKRALIAAPVWLLARNSITCPRSTNVVMAAAASKYTATSPPGPRNFPGNMPGKAVPTTLKT